MKKQAVLLAALVCLLASDVRAQSDPLAAARFLIGKWTYVNTGKPGEPTGWTSFASSLGDRVIVRLSNAKYPAAAGRAAYTHEDMLVISSVPGAIRGDYYDNAGYVSRYTVTSPVPNTVVFTSDKVKDQVRARLSYKLEANGRLTAYYEAAPANAPEKFAIYAVWSLQR